MNKWPRQSGSLTPTVLQSLGCQGLAVPGACCSHHAIGHWLNGAGTNPPSPSSKQGVQVQAPLLESHLLFCQVWTSHSHSAAEACISSIEFSSSLAWNTSIAPMFLFFNMRHQHSPKWFHISCCCTAPKPPDAALVPPCCGSFSYMSGRGADRLCSEPRAVSVLHMGQAQCWLWAVSSSWLGWVSCSAPKCANNLEGWACSQALRHKPGCLTKWKLCNVLPG